MSKKAAVLKLMQRQWVTVHIAQRVCGLNALSQRISELKKEGHKIASERVKGEAFNRYRVIG